MMKIKEIKLDIGCGGSGTKYAGFIGIDKHRVPKKPRIKNSKYLSLDVTKDKLPYRGEVQEIVCFHLLEHLTEVEGVKLLSEIREVLTTGGYAYVTTPDARLLAYQYLSLNHEFFDSYLDEMEVTLPNSTSFVKKYIGSLTGFGKHKMFYDVAGLVSLGEKAGWSRAEMNILPPAHEWNFRADIDTGLIFRKK